MDHIQKCRDSSRRLVRFLAGMNTVVHGYWSTDGFRRDADCLQERKDTKEATSRLSRCKRENKKRVKTCACRRVASVAWRSAMSAYCHTVVLYCCRLHCSDSPGPAAPSWGQPAAALPPSGDRPPGDLQSQEQIFGISRRLQAASIISRRTANLLESSGQQPFSCQTTPMIEF